MTFFKAFTKITFITGALLGIGISTDQGGVGAVFPLLFFPPLWPFLGGYLFTCGIKELIQDKL